LYYSTENSILMLIKISAGLLKLFLLAILMKPLRILIIIFNKLEISWSPFWTSIHFIKIESKSATAPTALPVLSSGEQSIIIIIIILQLRCMQSETMTPAYL